MKKCLLLILSALVVSCASPAERFARKVDLNLIESDRSDVISEIRGIENPDFKNDAPNWRVIVDNNCVTILIRGRFEEKEEEYGYQIKENYLIDIPAKGYYHYCRDTVIIYVKQLIIY